MRRYLILLLAAAACTDPLPLTGNRYALNSIAGVALPAPYAFNKALNEVIVADTLTLGANGKGVREVVYETGAAPAARYRTTDEFTYVVVGDRIQIAFECNDLASCIAPPHFTGVISASGITLDHSAVTLEPLIYARVPGTTSGIPE